jgi:acetyl-CoA carboxylase biotin carboxyl carrier protein
MDFNEIRKLVKLVEGSGIHSLEIEEGDFSIRIEGVGGGTYIPAAPVAMPQQAAPLPAAAPAAPADLAAPAEAAPAASSNLIEIKAPMVGTFYAAPNPDSAPFIAVGDTISPGKTLCILEAMKIMNEIEAEQGGRIVEILVENGQPVQFEQVLFRMEAL